MKHKVYLSNTDDTVQALKDSLSKAFQFAGVSLPVGRSIIVKPNMTWTSWKPGVTTTPALLEALAEILVDHGDRLTFVEGDGGMNSWKAEEALYSHGCHDLAKRFGDKVGVRSVMHEPTRIEPVTIQGTKVAIPLPESLLDPDKFFITIPTLKTHCMSYVSLNYKNQWGCIPNTKRLRHHHMLASAVIAINRLIGVDLSIVDAITALDGNGPMYGEEIPFGALIVGREPGAVARVCTRVMQLDHLDAPILRLADQLGQIPRDESIETSSPVEDFLKHRFRPVVLPKNRISIGLSKSKWATWFVYDSPVTPVIYGIRKSIFGWKGIPRNAVPEWIYDYPAPPSEVEADTDPEKREESDQ
ncbi:MAG: DUF362 domain-containing protein [Deltaproteobacteria bacterium]|nr:DUF362 domain-containing protein [Deltaproteobacteria bacterium]